MQCPHCKKEIKEDQSAADRAKERAAIEAANTLYNGHNVIAQSNVQPYRDPPESKGAWGIIGAPLGYFGVSCGMVIGPFRDTIQEAKNDAIDGAEWIEKGGVSAAAHAWRAIN